MATAFFSRCQTLTAFFAVCLFLCVYILKYCVLRKVQSLWQLHILTLWNISWIFAVFSGVLFLCLYILHWVYSKERKCLIPKCSLYWRWIFLHWPFYKPPIRIQDTADCCDWTRTLGRWITFFSAKIGLSESFSSRLAVYETHAAFCRNQRPSFLRCSVKVFSHMRPTLTCKTKIPDVSRCQLQP